MIFPVCSHLVQVPEGSRLASHGGGGRVYGGGGGWVISKHRKACKHHSLRGNMLCIFSEQQGNYGAKIM